MARTTTLRFSFGPFDIDNIDTQSQDFVSSFHDETLMLPIRGRNWVLKLLLQPNDGNAAAQSAGQQEANTSDYICAELYRDYPVNNKVKHEIFVNIGGVHELSCRSGFDFSGGVVRGGVYKWSKFILKSRLVASDLLEQDGTLKIEILLRELETPLWFPKKEPNGGGFDTMTKLREDSTWTDVDFLVEGKVFHAHKNILSVVAPILITGEGKAPSKGPIELTGIAASTFENILAFSYDRSLPNPVDTLEEATRLLVSADRFACKPLKFFMESTIADEFLTGANAAELLVLSDSHSCALLKEVALREISRVPDTVFASEGWNLVKKSEHLMMQVTKAGYMNSTEDDRKRKIDCMDVGHLRDKLDAKGMDIDGSRETLIKRLKDSGETDSDPLPTTQRRWTVEELRDLAYARASPAFLPESPSYNPRSPQYQPASPAYSPDSPAYSPRSPQYQPVLPAAYNP